MYQMQKMAGRRVGMSDLGMRRRCIWHFQSGAEYHTVSGSSQHSLDGILAPAT